MFLSRVPLDVSNRNTLLALNSPNKFHGALESSFTGERKRNLWRLDSFNGQLYFLAVTEENPDFSKFCEQFAKEGASWETKPYDNFLQSIQNGNQFRFRLTANPTTSEIFTISNSSFARFTMSALSLLVRLPAVITLSNKFILSIKYIC